MLYLYSDNKGVIKNLKRGGNSKIRQKHYENF